MRDSADRDHHSARAERRSVNRRLARRKHNGWYIEFEKAYGHEPTNRLSNRAFPEILTLRLGRLRSAVDCAHAGILDFVKLAIRSDSKPNSEHYTCRRRYAAHVAAHRDV
jgi:hypothetical protein